MQKPIEKVGFIGFGPMGQFMAENMFEGCEIMAHDPNRGEERIGNVALVGFDEALEADATVLAVPAAVLHEVADRILFSPSLDRNPLLIDVSSVKIYPGQVFDRFLPNYQEVLLCHPLFGPQSADKSLRGHRVIVTESFGEKAEQVQQMWKTLGLNILNMTAEEHDKQMAMVQAVPFIFGRLASQLALDDMPSLQTPSRLAVRKLQWLDEVQSDELFQSMIEFNPFVPEVTAQLQEKLEQLQERTEKGNSRAIIAKTELILADTKK